MVAPKTSWLAKVTRTGHSRQYPELKDAMPAITGNHGIERGITDQATYLILSELLRLKSLFDGSCVQVVCAVNQRTTLMINSMSVNGSISHLGQIWLTKDLSYSFGRVRWTGPPAVVLPSAHRW